MRRVTIIHLHYRADWMDQLGEVHQQFEVDYVYTCYARRHLTSQGLLCCAEHQVDDFGSACALLDKLKPQVILMYSIGDGLYSAAIALEARHRGIPVAVFDHGIRLEVEFNLAKEGPKASMNRPKRAHNLSFMFRSLRLRGWQNWARLLLMQTIKLVGLNGLARTSAFFKDLRMADAYITYSPHNALYVDHDGTDGRRLFLTGIPNFDPYFEAHLDGPGKEDSLLFVDQPLGLIAASYGFPGIEPQRIRLLRSLESYCQEQNLRLVIRPHPFQTDADYKHFERFELSRAPLEVFRKEVEDAVYIAGFCSTVMLPVLALRPAVVLGTQEIPDFKALFRNPDYARLVHYVSTEDFTLADLAKARDLSSQSSRADFIRHYLHSIDGQARQRVAEAVHAMGRP